MIKRLIIIVLLLLTLSSCSKYDFINEGYIRADYVEKIASERKYTDYIFTMQPVYNCEYEDAYIITFYIHSLRYVTATYLAYRIGDEIYWEVVSIE